ncbi:hypothetical protein ACFFRR_000959 [Megaselia abdita]
MYYAQFSLQKVYGRQTDGQSEYIRVFFRFQKNPKNQTKIDKYKNKGRKYQPCYVRAKIAIDQIIQKSQINLENISNYKQQKTPPWKVTNLTIGLALSEYKKIDTTSKEYKPKFENIVKNQY